MSARKEKELGMEVVGSEYGALNDLQISQGTPTADRRTLSTTTAISTVVGDFYTPDVLKDKDEFLGVVLASLPSQIPRLSSKTQQIEAKSVKLRKKKGNPLFYTYKVYIPELESRCLDFNEKTTSRTRGAMSPLSMAQRIATMQDFSLDVSLYNASEGVRAIQPGTLVKIVFEDLATMRGPKIVEIFKKVFQFQATGTTESNINKFNGLPPALPGKVAAEGNNEFFWSGGKRIWEATYQTLSNQFIEVANGYLEDVVDEKTGPIIQSVEGTKRLKLIVQAHEDWKNLKEAYSKRFPEAPELKVLSGYRNYAGQAAQRIERIKCGPSSRTDPKPVDPKTATALADLKGQRVVAGSRVPKGGTCKQGGIASIPGQSRHGWGISVDLNRDSYYRPRGTPGRRTQQNVAFRWLNQYAIGYGWIFNVGGETWHLSWTKAGDVYRGNNAPGNLGPADRAFKEENDGITDDTTHPYYIAEHAPEPAPDEAPSDETSEAPAPG